MNNRGGKTQRWYHTLYGQVMIGIALGILVGVATPALGVALKPLGDIFLRLIKMVIGLVIFCTVVSGIGGMQEMKKVGRLGGKALIYFEVVSTFALLFGAAVANLVRPGYSFDVHPADLDAHSMQGYLSQSHPETIARRGHRRDGGPGGRVGSAADGPGSRRGFTRVIRHNGLGFCSRFRA